MKIWELKSSTDDYQSFHLLNYKEDNKYFKKQFNSKGKLSNSWTDIFIKLEDKGTRSDCPIFLGKSGVRMISGKAKQILEPLIGDNVEFLPLIHTITNEKYYAIHVLNVLDALDSDNTVFEKLSSGLIIGCEKYSFIPSIVQNQAIFKIYINKIIHPTAIFVSDEFRNAVLESDLKGFEFVEVWDSELNM
ncbi:DUF1629 domain-containing protein [Bacillus sp. S2(2024)]|uniref:imm11 family protein n=1 Tax=Bacillus sp. S2(2024) TaxID=3162887 RepID=UPI003D197A51